jgi:hypothetical protein
MRFRDRDGTPQWGYVCGNHDRVWGRRNVQALTGWSTQQVVDWDNRFLKEDWEWLREHPLP